VGKAREGTARDGGLKEIRGRVSMLLLSWCQGEQFVFEQDLPLPRRMSSAAMCGKSKTLPFHAETACKWSGGMAPMVLNLGLWSASRLGGFTPGKERRYSLNMRLGGKQGWSGRLCRKYFAYAGIRTSKG
jgi:hypothetical protein